MLVIYHVGTGNIRQMSRNTPAGEVPPEMIPDGCAAVKTDRTDISGDTHRVNVSGQIVKKPAADVEARQIDAAWRALRSRRAQLLAATDWTQVSDAPVNKVAWRAYRQALRDLPQNTTDPRNAEWPEAPE